MRFHREDASINTKAFTSKYKCFYLVYYEHFNDIEQAIIREKQIKGWLRVKKDKLITNFNPNWEFLNDSLWDASVSSEWQQSYCHSEWV